MSQQPDDRGDIVYIIVKSYKEGANCIVAVYEDEAHAKPIFEVLVKEAKQELYELVAAKVEKFSK